MNGKIIACAFSVICLTSIFAFGQQNHFVQNIFDIRNEPFGFEILNSQPHHQTLQITEDIAYEQLLRLISSFEKQAGKQLKEGHSRRAKFLRSYLQRKAGLTLEQANELKAYALDFTTEFGCRSNRAEVEHQIERYSSEKFNSERNQTLLEYRNRVRQLLGESGFDKFNKFVREKIASRITYSKNSKTQSAYFGMSMVDYDYQSNEVLGYSSTDEPPGHCQVITNIVSATLTSDAEGEVDSDSAEVCDGGAEVYLYFSDPLPEDRFCVDGEHQYARTYYPQLNDRTFGLFDNSSRKKNYGYCYYEKTESLPPSADCLTTPPLPNVTSVTYQLIQQGSTGIDANPNAGDGERIFPDDDTPGDTVNRQQIRVTARISENQAGIPIYFGNFDLDDPSDDMTIDPNGNAGGDNNGEVNGNRAGQLSAVSAVTNSSGTASVNFTVTRQPGDNFAIAAGVNQNAVSSVTVDGINLISGNGASIETNCDGTDLVCRSEMLTVWRRLHIEVDSMGAAQQNFITGTIPNLVKLRVNQTATITVNPSPNLLEPNRFEGGRLEVNGTSLPVTCVIANGDTCNTTNTVRVQNTSASSISIPSGSFFQLYDDDDFDDDDGTLVDGDTLPSPGEDITEPDISLLTANSNDVNTNVFASAYVRPVYDIVDTRDNSIFQANVESDDAEDIRPLFVDWDSSSTNIANEFWTVYVLGSYQHTLDEDNDPDANEELTAGIVDEITNVTGDLEGSGALIFLEVHRTREIPNYNPIPTDVTSLAITVAHEVGHLFSGEHGELGLMGDADGVALSNQFTPTTINKIRGLPHP